MSMVVGPAGFTGEESLPAPTRGYLSCYAAPAAAAGAGSLAGTQDAVSGEPAVTPASEVSVVGRSPETAMMDRFLDDYLRLMRGRVDLIQHYVDEIRYEEARVAILSLESASGMVGEAHLRRLLHDLRLSVDVLPADQQIASLAAIRAEADVVHERLSRPGD